MPLKLGKFFEVFLDILIKIFALLFWKLKENIKLIFSFQIPVLSPNGSAVLNEFGAPRTNINYNVTWLRRDPDYINYYNNW